MTLEAFFLEVITDTFVKEGIELSHDDFKEETLDKLEKVEDALKSRNSTVFFLAESGGQIVGTVSINPRGAFSKKEMPLDSIDVLEIACLYVKPEYQSKGIGTKLLNHARSTLKDYGYKTFILDSGYKEAQKIWEHRLGKPDKVLMDYWGKNRPHMFWYKQL